MAKLTYDGYENESFVIYRVTNTINNKTYVGQTIKPVKLRWKRHSIKTTKGGSAINLAINKYGVENFKFEVIDLCEDLDQMNHKECFWISFYNSISPNGYNLDSGGKNKVPSAITRVKQSAVKIGKKAKPEHIASRKAGLKAYFENEEKYTDEAKAKRRLNSTGRTHTQKTRDVMSAKAKLWASIPENVLALSERLKGIPKTHTEKMDEANKRKTGKHLTRTKTNNESGVVGVYFRVKSNQKLGAWNATCFDLYANKAISRSFSVQKYGMDEAKKMAIDWRNQQITILKGKI